MPVCLRVGVRVRVRVRVGVRVVRECSLVCLDRGGYCRRQMERERERERTRERENERGREWELPASVV